jgi:hypothetical protein
VHGDFVSYDTPDPTDGFQYSDFYIQKQVRYSYSYRKNPNDRQKVGIQKFVLDQPFETAIFRTLEGTCLARIRMKAHHYVVESSSEP